MGFTLVGSILILLEALSELKGLERELFLCMAILVLLGTYTVAESVNSITCLLMGNQLKRDLQFRCEMIHAHYSLA